MMYSNDTNNLFMDDFLISPLSFLSDHTMPSNLNADDWTMIDDLFDDTPPPSPDSFVDSPTANVTDDIVHALLSPPPDTVADNPVMTNVLGGLDDISMQSLETNFSDLFNSLRALPNNDSSHDNPPSIQESSNQSFVVKSSNTINTTNFINSYAYFVTGRSLHLTTPPFPYQRARYEKELKEVLRYIFVSVNTTITLTISDLLSNIAAQMSFFLRITRLTVPYEPDKLVFCHPYPIWLNDQNGRVHNGSLFIPITGQRIEIEKLILERLKQNRLRKIKQYVIFMPNQLDFDHFHVINTKKVKDVIGEYKLRCSVLHFQIFCVDQNNNAYPTDMQCQTENIYEYGGNELNVLPADVRQKQKQSLKLKAIGQLKKSSMKTKMSKKRKCD